MFQAPIKAPPTTHFVDQTSGADSLVISVGGVFVEGKSGFPVS